MILITTGTSGELFKNNSRSNQQTNLYTMESLYKKRKQQPAAVGAVVSHSTLRELLCSKHKETGGE